MFVIIYGKETGRCLHDDANSFTETLIRIYHRICLLLGPDFAKYGY